jgi:hypothetical protein
LDEDGHLTFKEFTVAMHLLFIAKLGYYLPVDLDPNTILPPSVSLVLLLLNKFPEFWSEVVKVTLYLLQNIKTSTRQGWKLNNENLCLSMQIFPSRPLPPPPDILRLLRGATIM